MFPIRHSTTPASAATAGSPAAQEGQRPAAKRGSSRHHFFKGLTVALFLFASWHAFMPNPGGAGLGQLDKLMHFAAFFSLALSGDFAQQPHPRAAWRLSALLLAYGALIEIAQIWIPGREASWLDLLADAVGIACGLALARLLSRWGPLRRLA